MLSALLKKEFRQIARNPAILRIMLIMPLMQLILIPMAADFEVKNINLLVVDHDGSTYSARLIDRLTASGYFKLRAYTKDATIGTEAMHRGEADLVIEIPAEFERSLVRENAATLHLRADAVNGVKAGMALQYASQIIRSVNQEIRLDFIAPTSFPVAPTLTATTRYWYNPQFNYRHYMAPGILALLLTMVGSMVCALNLVREREIGTLEQINVTPVSSRLFLLAKLIPFWVLGMASLTIGLVVCYVIFGIVPVGHYLTIYGFAAIFLFAALGIGQLLAIFSDTQQQVTLLAFFFMMTFVLLSGLYTPVESMPAWAKVLSQLNPVTHFVDVMRSVVLKGSSFGDLKHRFFAILGFALVFNAAAVLLYRKQDG